MPQGPYPDMPHGASVHSEGAESATDALEHLFTYHAPVGDQSEKYRMIRDAALVFARVIERCCPPSADRTDAVRKIRESVMISNASIATGGRGWR